MKIHSVFGRLCAGLFLGVVTLALSSCGTILYKHTEYNYAGRPIPPSGLQQRVLAAFTANGSSGGLEILDGLRDIRSNVQNTKPTFSITGYSGADPISIISYPEQLRGYVLNYTTGALSAINYGTEASIGSASSSGAYSPSAAASPDGSRFAGAAQTSGQFIVEIGGSAYAFSLPNVDKVVISRGGDAILGMVRNSNTLYRIVQLPASNNPVRPPGYVDCQPLLLPLYCVVPVAGTYDRPVDVSFSTDGTTAFVLNCGPECGGTQSSVSLLSEGALDINNIPTVDPLSSSAPSPVLTLPVANPIPIPGGVTTSLSNGTTLYLAGQQLQPDGLFTGFLTSVNLATYTASAPVSISDGTHTRLLFADDNTLWAGSSQCANGERQKKFAAGDTSQAANYNCLTRVSLASATPTATIIPAVSNGGAVVPYPNTNQDQYYYGSLTGICWVQGYHKVYTAYGGQIHAFQTATGTEINNFYITVQGVVNDVAYMDALTNSAN